MNSNQTSAKDVKPRPGSIKNKVVASDLEEERLKINFNAPELTEQWFGSKESWDEYKSIISVMENDPILVNTEKWYDMTREEQWENLFKKAKRIYEIDKVRFYHNYRVAYIPWFSAMFQGIFTFGLTHSMFTLAIENLGDEEQVKKYLPLIRQFRMLGCYAQTELGHGSNVAGLETTATFDQEKDEFVINSPTITSTKYWPGELGKFGNWAVVYARLIVNGKSHGVQAFLAQIRDSQTHMPVPGVECGDIGPKFGYGSKDNGFCVFSNLRIPRSQLLRRYVDLDREGNFSVKGDMRTLYSVMLFVRVSIALGASKYLAQALTIGTRYAVVRRQFSTQDGTKLERKLLDYQTHMFKYAPLLAYTYAMNFASLALVNIHLQLVQDVEKGNFGLLDLLHHLSSGYKASYTRITYDGIDTIRQSCGGAGFSAWSGLPILQTDYAPNTTFEGDNTVLHQQCAKFIIKNMKNIQRGFKPTGIFEYFNRFDELLNLKSDVKTVEGIQDLKFLENALAIRSAYKVKNTLTKIFLSKASENDNVNTIYAIDIVQMAHTHIMYVTFKFFLDHIEKHQYKSSNIKDNLIILAKIYALNELTQDSVALYETGYFPLGTAKLILDAMKGLMGELRPQMIPLVEAFAVPDSVIVSAIGNSYGDIYETQLQWAKESRLNKEQVAPGFKEHIMPILHGKL